MKCSVYVTLRALMSRLLFGTERLRCDAVKCFFVTSLDFDVSAQMICCFSFIPLNVLRLAHIRGNRHKRKLASLRKQAQYLAAAEVEHSVRTVSELTDAETDSYVADNEMSD